jgi:hypothetical protein
MNTSGNESIRSSKIDNLSSIDSINLKIAKKPATYYRLIQCERSLLKDYTSILTKIRTLYNFSNKYAVILYVKNINREDIKITNETEWNVYIENNTILELIDSKNTLKIEYELTKGNLDMSYSEKATEDKISELFDNEGISNTILRTIFAEALKSENIKHKIKEGIAMNFSQTENNNFNSYLNTRSFDVVLKRFLDKTVDNIKYINSIKGNFEKELEDDRSISDILLMENDDYMNVPSFIEFYNKSEVKDDFKSRISQTFADFKKSL